MHHGAQHIPSFIQALAPVVGRYGYAAVGGLLMLEDFGVPAPGETVLVAASFYAGLGQLSLPLVILVSFLGAVIGDNIGFAIGHFGGHPLVGRFGRYVFLTPDRVNRATAFFERHGGRVVAVARFIEGLRQINGIVAGISGMHWLRFLVFNMLGAAIWVSAWSLAGYFGGSHISTFLHYQAYFSITVLCLLAAYAVFRFVKSRRHQANA